LVRKADRGLVSSFGMVSFLQSGLSGKTGFLDSQEHGRVHGAHLRGDFVLPPADPFRQAIAGEKKGQVSFSCANCLHHQQPRRRASVFL